MKLITSVLPTVAALTCAACTFFSTASAADLLYHVSLNTTPLISSAAGPFYVDFQLNDGAGTGNGNNTALLTGFTFGGGSATGATFGDGGFSGSLTTSVKLTDTSAFNEFYQRFTAGSTLDFNLILTTNLNINLIPDLFSFAILDSSLANIPTFSPGLSDSLLLVNIDSTPTVEAYAANGSIAPSAGGAGIALAAPSLTAVPEPSTYGLFGVACLVGLAVWRRRRRS